MIYKVVITSAQQSGSVIRIHTLSFRFLSRIYMITEYWVELRELHSRSLLACHSIYLSVHMSGPNPHSFPPHCHLSFLHLSKYFSVIAQPYIFLPKPHFVLSHLCLPFVLRLKVCQMIHFPNI